MSNLRRDLNKRDDVFERLTNDVFMSVKPVLIELTKHIKSVNDIVKQGQMKWNDIVLLDDNVLFIGSITYEIGQRLKLSASDYITINDDNLLEYECPITFEVPVDIVENNDVDKLQVYLLDTSVNVDFSENTPEEYKSIFNGETTENRLIHIDVDGFNLESLSDSQRESLESLSVTSKYGKN